MAAADYRLMTEATGQRIAAALEALSGFGAYLTTADVVNNLTSTATDKPLSAAQGKALNDLVAQSTAVAYQELTYGTLTRQLNASVLSHKFVSLVFRRYGYYDTMLIPVDTIKNNMCGNGKHIRYNTNDITVSIDQNGLITLSGGSADQLAIEARGFL